MRGDTGVFLVVMKENIRGNTVVLLLVVINKNIRGNTVVFYWSS